MTNDITQDNYRPVSILLVDDDEVDVMGVQRAFKKLRLSNKLFRAKNGEEALKMLRDKTVVKPFLILLDLNMPVMGGLEMLEHLRRDSALTDSVVFVLTTSQADEDITAAYREHIAGYIVKSRLDAEFNELLNILGYYWRIIELPED